MEGLGWANYPLNFGNPRVRLMISFFFSFFFKKLNFHKQDIL